MRVVPLGSSVIIFGPQQVELYGKDRECGLVGGGVSLGVGVEASNALTIPS